MLAVVLVRDGEMPAGAQETIAECDGRALVCEIAGFAPAAVARAIAHATDGISRPVSIALTPARESPDLRASSS